MLIVEYLDQLRNLGRRLADANAALIVWDEIDAQKRLPGPAPTLSREKPRLSRQALKVQLIMLMADMSRLEQEICSAPYATIN